MRGTDRQAEKCVLTFILNGLGRFVPQLKSVSETELNYTAWWVSFDGNSIIWLGVIVKLLKLSLIMKLILGEF